MSRMESSNTPCVDGYVIMRPARCLPCSSAFFLRSATSTLPFGSVATTTTLKPAMTALAGLVPCAEAGINTTSRAPSTAVEVLEELAAKKGMTKTAVLKQALRLYQMVDLRLSEGAKLFVEDEKLNKKAELMVL